MLLVFSLSRVNGFVSEAPRHAPSPLFAALYITTTPAFSVFSFQFLMTELRAASRTYHCLNMGVFLEKEIQKQANMYSTHTNKEKKCGR
jgi:hypothetical protein